MGGLWGVSRERIMYMYDEERIDIGNIFGILWMDFVGVGEANRWVKFYQEEADFNGSH